MLGIKENTRFNELTGLLESCKYIKEDALKLLEDLLNSGAQALPGQFSGANAKEIASSLSHHLLTSTDTPFIQACAKAIYDLCSQLSSAETNALIENIGYTLFTKLASADEALALLLFKRNLATLSNTNLVDLATALNHHKFVDQIGTNDEQQTFYAVILATHLQAYPAFSEVLDEFLKQSQQYESMTGQSELKLKALLNYQYIKSWLPILPRIKTLDKYDQYFSLIHLSTLKTLSKANLAWLYATIATRKSVSMTDITPPEGVAAKICKQFIESSRLKPESHFTYFKMIETLLDEESKEKISSILFNLIKIKIRNLSPKTRATLKQYLQDLKLKNNMPIIALKSTLSEKEFETFAEIVHIVSHAPWHYRTALESLEAESTSAIQPRSMLSNLIHTPDKSALIAQDSDIAETIVNRFWLLMNPMTRQWLRNALATGEINTFSLMKCYNKTADCMTELQHVAMVLPLVLTHRNLISKITNSNQLKPVHQLILDNLPLKDCGLNIICQALQRHNEPIQALSVENTQITDIGLTHCMRTLLLPSVSAFSFSKNKALTRLSIQELVKTAMKIQTEDSIGHLLEWLLTHIEHKRTLGKLFALLEDSTQKSVPFGESSLDDEIINQIMAISTKYNVGNIISQYLNQGEIIQYRELYRLHCHFKQSPQTRDCRFVDTKLKSLPPYFVKTLRQGLEDGKLNLGQLLTLLNGLSDDWATRPQHELAVCGTTIFSLILGANTNELNAIYQFLDPKVISLMKELTLSFDKVNDTQVDLLLEALKHSVLPIETVRCVGGHISTSEMTGLCHTLEQKKSIRTLVFNNISLAQTSLLSLNELIIRNHHIQSLSLIRCDDLYQHMKVLCEALLKSNIKSLTLRHIDREPSKRALTLLKLKAFIASPNCPLTKLDLSHNGLSNSEVVAIISAIQKNPNSKIKSLKLGHNQIGNLVFSKLAQVLPQSSITELDLDEHSAGSHAFDLLVQSLPKSHLMKVSAKPKGFDPEHRSKYSVNPELVRVFNDHLKVSAYTFEKQMGSHPITANAGKTLNFQHRRKSMVQLASVGTPVCLPRRLVDSGY